MEKLHTKAKNSTLSNKKSITDYSRNSKIFNEVISKENVVRMSDEIYVFKVDIELNQENTLTKKEL